MTETTVTIQGVAVPRIGYGTFQLSEAECVEGVGTPSSWATGTSTPPGPTRTSAASGAAGRQRRAPGGCLPHHQDPATRPSRRRRPRASVEGSLQDLGTDYVDLILIHWPNPDVALEETLGTLVKLREEGKVRQLGVSNFPPGLLRRALDLAPVFTNQVEYHPYLIQPRLLDLMGGRDLLLTAYGPMAQGEVHRPGPDRDRRRAASPPARSRCAG